jgi:asparaginyl-tRNA synthetase
MLEYEKVKTLAGPWADATEAAVETAMSLGYRPFFPMRTIVDVTGACEQISTLYRVDHYGKPHFLAQSGQLDLELATHELKKAWTVIPSSRQEVHSEDPVQAVKDVKRRLSQFTLFEGEFISKNQGDTYEDGEVRLDELAAQVSAIIGNMQSAVKGKANGVERVTYTEAIKLLKHRLGFPGIEWGHDLSSDHEKMLCAYFGKDVIATHFPRAMKFFNMADSDEEGLTVLSLDYLCMGVGESLGGAVREVDPNKIIRNLLGSDLYRLGKIEGVKDSDYAGYINVHISPESRVADPIDSFRRLSPAFDAGVPVFKSNGVGWHSGFGIGMNRVMQSILGLDDIREATPFVVNSCVAAAV